jgi:heterodisulfide reductase subunit A
MVAAKTLSDQGYEVDLLEKASALGGQALNLYKTWLGEDIQENLRALVTSVQGDKNIRTHLGAELTQVEGFVGNFKST